MGELAIAAMHRIIKKAGAERVSESAAIVMGRVLEEIGIKIGREAIDWSMHAGRKTVKAGKVRSQTPKIEGTPRTRKPPEFGSEEATRRESSSSGDRGRTGYKREQ